MATGKVSRLLISTRHLIIEYSKKGLSAVHIQRLLHHKHNVTITRHRSFVRFVYCSFVFRFVRSSNQTDERNERYTKRAIHETNDTRSERTKYTNEAQTNGKRKTNERYTQTKRTKNAHDTKYLLT
jgi:hypothetical protein